MSSPKHKCAQMGDVFLIIRRVGVTLVNDMLFPGAQDHNPASVHAVGARHPASGFHLSPRVCAPPPHAHLDAQARPRFAAAPPAPCSLGSHASQHSLRRAGPKMRCFLSIRREARWLPKLICPNRVVLCPRTGVPYVSVTALGQPTASSVALAHTHVALWQHPGHAIFSPCSPRPTGEAGVPRSETHVGSDRVAAARGAQRHHSG